MHRFWSCVPAIAVAIFASGCVTVYQPLTSLQKPTAIERAADNFAGQRILIRCIPESMKPADAQRLCSKLSSLFSNQGAQVDVAVPAATGAFAPPPIAGARPDLVIELKSRTLHKANPPFMWAACVMSCSIIPAYREVSIAQEVSIRDADGFELASDSLEARFVEYIGGGLWLVNRTLDLTVREEDEQLIGSAEREFSKDFYRQLTQLAFNARVRAAVLRSFEPAAAPPGTPKKAVN